MKSFSLLAKLATIVLFSLVAAGCANGPVAVAFGPNAKNPNTFGVVAYNPPQPQAVTVNEKSPDGVTRPYRYSCPVGKTLGEQWVGAERHFQCQAPDGTLTAANRSFVNVVGNGGGYNGYGGDNLSQYCQPNGCGKVNGQWVRY